MSETSIIKLISAGKKIMIEDLSGEATIAQTKKIIKSCHESFFENQELNQPGIATGQALLAVHELVREASFAKMFAAVSNHLDKIVMTQHQIIRCCEKYPIYFCPKDFATFFLTKRNWQKLATEDNLLVIHLHLRSDGFYAVADSFRDDYPWSAIYHHRIISIKTG